MPNPWNSSSSSEDDSAWSKGLSIEEFLKRNCGFNPMSETIRHVMQKMLLSELELLRDHIGNGIVSVVDPAQKKVIQTELRELVEERKETIRKNEQKWL